MHLDKRNIKKHPYKVSLNDAEQAFLEMAASVAGEQPSAYIRELAMEKLREVFAIEQAEQANHNRRAG